MKREMKKEIKRERKSVNWIVLIVLLILLIIMGFLFMNFNKLNSSFHFLDNMFTKMKALTGRVVFNQETIQTNYSVGEKLNGSIVLNIENGDEVQKDVLINIQLKKGEEVVASNSTTFNDFLTGLQAVEITKETSVCENVSLGVENVCENITVENVIENCTSELNENNETINICVNETQESIVENCTERSLGETENCQTQTTTDYYFNQAGSYSKNISELIDYTFIDSGNYKLIISSASLGLSYEKDIFVNEGINFGILSTPGNIASCQKLDTAGVYTMTTNLNESMVNSTGCFNITVSNVELDCAGYLIRNTTLGKPGISAYNVSGLTNITIRNCNVSIGSSGNYGIDFRNVNNSAIINNTLLSKTYLSTGSNLNITSNVIYTNQLSLITVSNSKISSNNINVSTNFADAIIINSGSNNTITSNTIFASGANAEGIVLTTNSNSNNITLNTIQATNIDANGVYIVDSSSNIINQNNISSQGSTTSSAVLISNGNLNIIINNNLSSDTSAALTAHGIYILTGFDNIFTGNTINSIVKGIYLSGAINNTFTNNNVWNCIDTTNGCIYLTSTSQNNTFVGGVVNKSTSNLIYIETDSNNNLFKDMILVNSTRNNTFLTSTSINNTFLNVSYNNSLGKESVASGSQLIRKWYLDVNVTDGANALVSANVSAWNVSNNLQFSELTATGGTITQQQLIEYINNGAASGINRTYYTSYSINATKTNYRTNSTNLNLTESSVLSLIIADITAPSITLSSPTSGASYSGVTYGVLFVFDASDSGIGIANCSAYANGAGYINTSAITATNNNITASLSAGAYAAYVNCTDLAGNVGNSSTITFTITAPASATSSSGGSLSVIKQFWQVTQDVSNIDLKNSLEKRIAYRERLKINLSVNGNIETHYVGIGKLTTTYAIVNVSSIEQSAKLYSGNEEKFDINLDGNYYELSVKLNSIQNNKADLTLKEINEKIIKNESESDNLINENEAPAQEEENEKATQNLRDYMLILIIAGVFALLIIIVSFYIYYLDKKKNKGFRRKR